METIASIRADCKNCGHSWGTHGGMGYGLYPTKNYYCFLGSCQCPKYAPAEILAQETGTNGDAPNETQNEEVTTDD